MAKITFTLDLTFNKSRLNPSDKTKAMERIVQILKKECLGGDGLSDSEAELMTDAIQVTDSEGSSVSCDLRKIDCPIVTATVVKSKSSAESVLAPVL